MIVSTINLVYHLSDRATITSIDGGVLHYFTVLQVLLRYGNNISIYHAYICLFLVSDMLLHSVSKNLRVKFYVNIKYFHSLLLMFVENNN